MSSNVTEQRKSQLDERIRGVIVMIAGMAVLVGVAYGAMTLLTAEDGWAMRAANASAESGIETPQLASSIDEQQ